ADRRDMWRPRKGTPMTLTDRCAWLAQAALARHKARWIGAAALALAALAGCTPKAGDKCSAGQQVCLDATGGLFCSSSGTFATMSCRGSQGCVKNGGTVLCDNSLANKDEGCA